MVIAIESTELLSGDRTGQWLHKLLRWIVPSISHAALESLNHILRKIGHFIGYAGLSFLIFRAFRGTYRASHEGYYGWLSSRIENVPVVDAFSRLWNVQWAVMGWMGASLVATLDELHQMTLRSRTGTWWDVLLDSSAAIVAQIAIYRSARRKVRRRQTH